MNIYFISIFPEIYSSFLSASILSKSVDKGLIKFFLINPRAFCTDKHKQVDDEIYGGGNGMLLKVRPFVDALENVLEEVIGTFKIVLLSPSNVLFDQKKAVDYSKLDNIIFVCGRYEGIDARFERYCRDRYAKNFEKISIGKYVMMGGEVASMAVVESIVRLLPGVITENSHQIESYDINKGLDNIEFPQFTRPEEAFGYKVPDVLLSGNHSEIEKWRNKNENSKN